jgi:DNA mismatch repair ATPase MutS
VPISLHLTHFTELMTKDLVREGERVRFLRMCTVEEQGEHVNSFELGTGYITDSRSFDTAERMGLNREFVGSAKKYFKRLVRGQTVRG